MENFQYCIGTNILFGKGQIENLAEVIKPFGNKVLLTYGGGSIKRIGLYDKIKSMLTDCEVHELAGIAPNPKLESVTQGVAICKEKKIDVVLAVGGGSVIDCSKAIIAGAKYNGNPWDIITRKAPIADALPLIAVPTMAATGSEMDAGAVISNPDTNEKMSFFSGLILPYFVPAGTFMGDMLVESVMKTVIKYAPMAIAEPENYEARAQLLWASNIGDNATLCNGNRLCAFGVHAMEHELSAFYDIAHGVGLAILTPNWMEYVLAKHPETVTARFAQYGRNVWSIVADDDSYVAKQAIAATRNFLKGLNIPMTLEAVGIGTENFEAMANHCIATEPVQHAWVPLAKDDIMEIFKMSLK